MLLDLHKKLKRALANAAATVAHVDVEDPVIEVPRDLAHADLASPIAFELAKRLKAATGEKCNPRELAAGVVGWLRQPEHVITGIGHIEVAGAGYINFFLDRGAVLSGVLRDGTGSTMASSPKIIVEHTSVNPNKAAHVGHLRNAVLGDTVVRLLRANGFKVEVQNYIDNTGVQVADVVVGFLHVEPKTLDEVRAIPDPFDHYCWDLYARVGLFYRDGDPDGRENSQKLALRGEVQHALESGSGPVAELAEYVAMRNLECLLRTMARLGIEYDVLPRESEVLHSNFWSETFQILKEHGAVHFEDEGRHAGCWVMPAEGGTEAENDQFAADKILVKSNGLVTYTGKDLGYHFWKVGLVDRDFAYRPFFTYDDGRVAWITTSGEGTSGHPRFGHGARYVNVIDVGQSYVQEFVRRGVLAVSDDPLLATSTHFDYEKVGLTVATCDALGLELTGSERAKSFIGMSGRKGRGVKADDLIDRLEAAALERMASAELSGRTPLSADEQREAARLIAIGALRYFLLKYSRNSVIAFDFREALALEGETGPYLQYTRARLNSLFAKLAAAGFDPDESLQDMEAQRLTEMLAAAEGADLWETVLLAAQLPEVLRRACDTLEPAVLAKYAFQVAQAFNNLYQRHPIIKEPDAGRRRLLVGVCRLIHRTLGDAMDVLGIPTPFRM